VPEQPGKSSPSDSQTLLFMTVLSIVCAVILSLLASALSAPIEEAKELDRSKQMMIAARILSGEASRAQIRSLYDQRLQSLLVNDKGELFTFKQVGINEEEYVAQFKKSGYYKQPYKLVYKVLPADHDKSKERDLAADAEAWIFPINGMGLWDAIYGYLAIAPDGVTVIGITWYDQKETPGLGANIADEPWQSLFPGKKIFQENADGTIDTKTAPLGIVVVKGKVSEVYGESPKAKSAVDGMAGATLTGNGVTDAYQYVLAPYRPFLQRLNAASKEQPKVKE
jgi:Na+-transporting NADH:ubiquinone oxidoreductase subunit C